MVTPLQSRPPPSRPPPARVSPSAVERARVQRDANGPVELLRDGTPLDATLRFLRRHGLALLATTFSLLHLAGAFGARGQLLALAASIPLALTVVVAGVWRLRRAARGERVALRLDVALGIVLNAAAYALLQATGDRTSTLYPVVYLLSAWFAVAPLPRVAALGLVGAAVLQNALRYVTAEAFVADWHRLVVQTGFILLFALLYHLLLAARLWASRSAESEAVSRRLREAEESARSLRLIVADRSRDARGETEQASREQRLLLGAVLEVERSVSSILEGAHLAIGGHAVALYWLSDDEATLALRDGRCAAGLLAAGPLGAGDGILGSALRHGQIIRQTGKIPGVTWYERSVAVRSVCIVPVVERAVDGTGFVRGAILADRLESEPFSEQDARFLGELATQVARAVESERLVGELHRAKDAQDRLHRAADELNRASTVEEVTRAAARLACSIVPGLDVAAVTRTEVKDGARSHVVCAAEGARATEFDGLVYDDNDGLVAHVVRLGAPMPARPPGVLERVKIFDLKLAGFGALRVLPLVAGGRVLGTLVAGGRKRTLFDDESRTRLEAVASLAAGALARALALAEVSALATTDGLTGLSNRRRLDELSARAFAEAKRYGKPLSVLVTDVDHFKKVNDTHGHAAGDDVLRHVASILKSEARDTDVVGRYGGEEFVLVLPSTDAEGARELAERIRKRIEASPAATSVGEVRVTLSLGVAGFPTHGEGLDALVHAGDEALYEAKRAGRNRVVLAGANNATKPAPNAA